MSQGRKAATTSILGFVLLGSAMSASWASGAPAGTAFTYQGRLQDGGSVARGLYDFQFSLYDAASGGERIGSTLSIEDVTVAEGLFTVSLDFGSGAFSGSARWLAIEVRPGASTGAFTAFASRQEVTPAPQALYSTSAGSFSGALGGDVTGSQANTTVTRLQGRPVASTAPSAGQVLAWSGGQWAAATPSTGVTSVTAAAPLASSGGATPNITLSGVLPIASGGTGSSTQSFVDLAGAQTVTGAKTLTSAPSFTAASVPFTVASANRVPNLNADLLDGVHAASFQQRPQNVVLVAKSGGDFTTISAALASITTASATNPYLIRVAPGVYTERVSMKSYVDIEGSGEQATTITYGGGAEWRDATVVSAADSAELRFLTVENSGGADYATAIHIAAGSLRLTHAAFRAWGGTQQSTGVWAFGGYAHIAHATVVVMAEVVGSGVRAEGSMANVSVQVLGSGDNTGVMSFEGLRMSDVDIQVTGATQATGVSSSGGIIRNLEVRASGSTRSVGVETTNTTMLLADADVTVSGSGTNYGVWNEGGSPEFAGLTVTASGGTNNYGMWNSSSSPAIRNSRISASGGTNDGIHSVASSGTHTIRIDASQITGGTSTIYQQSPYATRLGGSQIAGGGAFGGTYTCAASYDENYVALGTNCQ